MANHGTADLPTMLTTAGIGRYKQAMAIQYMNFLPRTCDLYAQGVILIVQGLQNLLKGHGADLEADGDFNPATEEVLKQFAGPLWYDKSWAQLYGDVINGGASVGSGRRGRAHGRRAMSGLGHTAYQHIGEFHVMDGGVGTIAAVAAGAFVWWKWFR